MRLPEAIRVLKANTMACHWPSGPYPGKRGTDWAEIFSEVRLLLGGIKERQDIAADAVVFVLDEANPETVTYNELVQATATLRRYGTRSRGELVMALTVPERHELAIARRTLLLKDEAVAIMGGPSREQALRTIKRLTGRSPLPPRPSFSAYPLYCSKCCKRTWFDVDGAVGADRCAECGHQVKPRDTRIKS